MAKQHYNTNRTFFAVEELPKVGDDGQAEVMAYLSKLTGRSVESLTAGIVEQWLEDNYADIAEPAEADLGLPSTVILTKKEGQFAKKSFNVMLANFKRLA
jgi:hypothetical protein